MRTPTPWYFDNDGLVTIRHDTKKNERNIVAWVHDIDDNSNMSIEDAKHIVKSVNGMAEALTYLKLCVEIIKVYNQHNDKINQNILNSHTLPYAIQEFIEEHK